MSKICRLIISVGFLLMLIEAASAQKVIKLDVHENFRGLPQKIIENVYSKKQGNPKFLKTYSETTFHPKSKSYLLRPISLNVYYSDEESFTTKPSKDPISNFPIDGFDRDGEKQYTYWLNKTGDAVTNKDTIYKIEYRLNNSFQNAGYTKINKYKHVEWRRNYSYNKKRLLSTITDYKNGITLNRKIKIDYLLFDTQGNWISRKETTTSEDGSVAGTTIVKRIITYY